MRRLPIIALMLALAACSTPPDQSRIERDIVFACLASGMFKLGNTLALSAVPMGALPAQVLNAGIDRVCADPAAVAGDVTKAAEIIAELREMAQ